MIKAEWGEKRVCGGCESLFYDMQQNPIVCPKCLQEYKADKTGKVLLRQLSIEPRKRITAALLTFQRINQKEVLLNKDIIREILSYLKDDVLAGAVYTQELVPSDEYLKQTMKRRFTKRYSSSLRTPYATKKTLSKFLDLPDGANE